MQTYEIKVQVRNGTSVWLLVDADDVKSAKVAANTQAELIREWGIYSDETSGLSNVIGPKKRPVGRPKTITDMKAYKREKARQYRAEIKSGQRVPKRSGYA